MTAPSQSASPSRTAAWKIVASVVVVGGVVGYLLYTTTLKGAEYYKHVDEVMANPAALQGKRLQVMGNVVEGSIEQAKGSLQWRFKLQNDPARPGAVIEASYRGIVPDNFKDGAQVVAKGMLTADNRLEVSPNGIMAKCPSKYKAAGPKTR